MSEVTAVASLLWFLVIALLSVKAISRAVAKECPKCFREVHKPQLTCFACGAAISARNDLEEYVKKSRARRRAQIGVRLRSDGQENDRDEKRPVGLG